MPDTAAPDLRRLGHFIAIVEALTDDAVASVASASGPAVDGAVRVVDIGGPVLVPMQALWRPHTTSAVWDLILDAR
jgi:hypothetical protein